MRYNQDVSTGIRHHQPLRHAPSCWEVWKASGQSAARTEAIEYLNIDLRQTGLVIPDDELIQILSMLQDDIAEHGDRLNPAGNTDDMGQDRKRYVWLTFAMPESFRNVQGVEVIFSTRQRNGDRGSIQVGSWRNGSTNGCLLRFDVDRDCPGWYEGTACELETSLISSDGLLVAGLPYNIFLVQLRLGQGQRVGLERENNMTVSLSGYEIAHKAGEEEGNSGEELTRDSSPARDQTSNWQAHASKEETANDPKTMQRPDRRAHQGAPKDAPRKHAALQCHEEQVVRLEHTDPATLSAKTSVTLATVASLDRTLVSLFAAAHWDGPVSVVYFAHSAEEREVLHHFAVHTFARFCDKRGQNLLISVVFNCSGALSDNIAEFPVNKLRWKAVAAAGTDLVLYVDTDFIPSKSALQHITEYYPKQTAGYSSVLVLPCFMTLPNSTWPKSAQISHDSDNLPIVELDDISKHKLQTEVLAARAMMPTPVHSHGATNYRFWLEQNESAATYSVDYTTWYEPYFVVNVSSWSGINGRGLFDERFYFGGGDKAQLSFEVAALGYAFTVHPAIYLVHVPHISWQSHMCNMCDSHVLTRAFCDGFELARRRSVMPRPEMHFESYFRMEFASFLCSLSAWNSSRPLPGVLCFQPPLSAFARIPSGEISSHVIRQYVRAIQQGASPLFHRTQPLLKACSTSARDSGHSAGDHEGKCYEEAAGPEGMRAELWNTCFGKNALEGSYKPRCNSSASGDSGVIIIDRRLLEGASPGSMEIDGAYYFEHALFVNASGVPSTLGMTLLSAPRASGGVQGDTGQISQVHHPCSHTEARSNELVLALDRLQGAGHEEEHEEALHTSNGPRRSIETLMRCRLLTTVYTAQGILKFKVLRDLWVSLWASDSLSERSMPHALYAFCARPPT